MTTKKSKATQFKKKELYEPEPKQEILAEEIKEVGEETIDYFSFFDKACTDITDYLKTLTDTVSTTLIDETIMHINKAKVFTFKVKAKYER